jgi:hypothetical protein
MTSADLKNKMRTLTQGQASDSVLDKMAGTFRSLAAVADFTVPAAPVSPDTESADSTSPVLSAIRASEVEATDRGRGLRIDGLSIRSILYCPSREIKRYTTHYSRA